MTVNVQADLEALYAAIIARAKGEQVTSAGHKEKSIGYAETPLADLIKLYRQLWTAASGLPDLKDLDQSTARRGPPAHAYFGCRR